MSLERNIATDRFGLGAKPGMDMPEDVRGWLRQQLRDYNPAPPALSAIPGALAIAASHAEWREMGMAASDDAEAARERRQQMRRQDMQILNEAGAMRLENAVASDTDFAERLVCFWSNHFAVSFERLPYRSLAAAYEVEAIRPRIMGNFADLLLSVASHPAMLTFLDQARSIGPGSRRAQRVNARRAERQLGLNENYAREILELHTLGVRSGYTQEDVTELARALTGWTVAGVGNRQMARALNAQDGETVFVADMHEPGRRTVLGKAYPDTGAQQALAILRDLAARPETARHVATKLATHFIADDPPAEAVARLERAFNESGGELSAVYTALIDEPAVWSAPRSKFRDPWDWMVASLRVTGMGASAGGNRQAGMRVFGQLGQPLWRPGSPAGWSDRMEDWASPGALISRVELANRFALRMGRQMEPVALSRQIMGEALRPATAEAIAAADARGMGLALLLASPEFMRR